VANALLERQSISQVITIMVNASRTNTARVLALLDLTVEGLRQSRKLKI